MKKTNSKRGAPGQKPARKGKAQQQKTAAAYFKKNERKSSKPAAAVAVKPAVKTGARKEAPTTDEKCRTPIGRQAAPIGKAFVKTTARPGTRQTNLQDKARSEKRPGGARMPVKKREYSSYSKEQIVTGVLRGNRRGFAFLLKEDGDLFIPHKSLMGAMHGDTVEAVIVDGDEAEVVKILKRGIEKVVGRYVKNKDFGFVLPDDSAFFSDIFVPQDKAKKAQNGDKVVVKITHYNDFKNPEGEIIEVLGKSGTVHADVLGLIRQAGFKEKFSAAQLEEAERVSKKPITPEGRTDFRELQTITIDGDDSKDFDDAVSIQETQSGWTLYVHIADVSEYIREGEMLDKEALKRATSVYLPNITLPMLPEVISNGCCSLNEGEDRYCLSAVMKVDKSGTVREDKITEGIMRSDARMTYKNVDKILQGDKNLKKAYADVAPMLEAMQRLAEKLHTCRHDRGSVDFQSDEAKILVEGDKVVSIEKYPYGISNGIIEEFMLLANETVAKFMESAKMPFVYRIHERPDPEKIDNVKVLYKQCGAPVNACETPKDVQKMLEGIKGNAAEKLLNKATLRAMQKAKYTGSNEGHFGLALTHYAHFTSPIRRYPDLLGHRIIKARLRGDLDERAIERWRIIAAERAEISSEREQAAERTERDTKDYFKALFMQDKVGEVFEGIISGVTGFGIFAELPNTVEGLIKVDTLPYDEYEYLPKQFMLKGRKHSYRLGDPIKVKVLSVSVEQREIYFEAVK